MKIQGKYIYDNGSEQKLGEYTVEEINEFLKNGHDAMLSLSGYTIDDLKCSASALTLHENTELKEENGQLIYPTYFRGYMIGKNNNDLIPVDAHIHMDGRLFISIVKSREERAQ